MPMLGVPRNLMIYWRFDRVVHPSTELNSVAPWRHWLCRHVTKWPTASVSLGCL